MATGTTNGSGATHTRRCSSMAKPAASMAAGVSGRVAAAEGSRPERTVNHTLTERDAGPAREHVLIEAELTAGTHYAAQLGQRLCLVGDRAQHEAGDSGVEGPIACGEPGVGAVDDGDPDRRLRSLGPGLLAQVGLRLDGDDLAHTLRVVDEVRAIAGAKLEHPSRESGEQLTPMRFGLRRLVPTQQRVEAREERMVDLLDGIRHYVRVSPREPNPRQASRRPAPA